MLLQIVSHVTIINLYVETVLVNGVAYNKENISDAVIVGTGGKVVT